MPQPQTTTIADNLVNDATQKALERFDETMRELALLRYKEFEHELEPHTDAVRRRGNRSADCTKRRNCTGRDGIDDERRNRPS